MSNSDVVIRVEGLGKKYSLHHEQSERYMALRDVVARQAKTAGRRLNPFTLAGQLRKAQREAAQEHAASEEEFWALKDVSFEIRRGERVGIIGRNGAGKSTLLKILSRITEPTTGRVEIRGRVASLLEVGTGFHPELTGRENIYLNGAILGMTRREIRSKFDEIVDFAEVEKFLDTPVKRYSSGMYVRLAFAVAAHLEPEILVVDEVLAVGDTSFQKKCLGKMEDVADREGRTILFVSHNMAALRTLCDKGLLLKSGLLELAGKIEEVMSAYESISFDSTPMYKAILNGDGRAYKETHFSPSSVEIIQDRPGAPIREDSSFVIRIQTECSEARNKSLVIGVIVTDETGRIALHTDSAAARDGGWIISKGSGLTAFEVPPGAFKPGKYKVRISGSEPMVRLYFAIEDAVAFEVVSENSALIRHGVSAWKATTSPAICKVSHESSELSSSFDLTKKNA
jgi:lipopolysaccharide transport system ATP-binding protein